MNNIKYYLFYLEIKEILVNFFLSFWQFLKDLSFIKMVKMLF